MISGPLINLGFYGALDARARELAGKISDLRIRPESAQLAYVAREAAKLYSSPELGLPRGELTASAVGEIFDLLEEKLEAFFSGREAFSLVMRERPELWESFMVEPPLGWYAQAAAQVLASLQEIRGKVLELGAGVGNTSRLVAGLADPSLYVRTDLNVKLLRASGLSTPISYFDFNRAGEWRDLDLVFAVNALHCAKNKTESLKGIWEMLKPGGVVLLGEGAPESLPGIPWSLNYLCGFFDGWWDEGGFLARSDWKALLSATGFTDIRTEALPAGDLELGGVIWARKA
jgi:SAM-dependent methyltransferase